ncbi:MAG: protoheme IX farnesyltransferase [Planctomycetes bacterium]|nr:protoheme IX farnesyltransferase [Planctomycetota bacterium]
MNTAVPAQLGLGQILADFVVLLKPRIASFVGLAAFVGGLLGADAGVSLLHIGEAALWITLAAGAASAFNQILERKTDVLMERTRGRPLPSGRVSVREALVFAGVLTAVSTAALWLRFNALGACLSLATIVAYVLVYTPLKRMSTFNTVVGALPGAAPPLIGYAALAGRIDPWAWVLFAILFVWQFPHFMAIAWIYRQDYSRAGMRMLPSAIGGERAAGQAAILYGLVLLPVSMVPALFGGAGVVFCAGTLVVGMIYCAASLLFAFKPQRATARTLLLVSLAYLPIVLALVVFDPATGVMAAHFTR